MNFIVGASAGSAVAVAALILGDLPFVGADKFFGKHLRKPSAAFFGNDRIQVSV